MLQIIIQESETWANRRKTFQHFIQGARNENILKRTRERNVEEIFRKSKLI